MPKIFKPKISRNYRFSEATRKALAKGVRIKKKEESCYDGTKLIEWLIQMFAAGKLKKVK